MRRKEISHEEQTDTEAINHEDCFQAKNGDRRKLGWHTIIVKWENISKANVFFMQFVLFYSCSLTGQGVLRQEPFGHGQSI